MKKLIFVLALLALPSFAYYGTACSEYGFMSYESSPWYCSCMSWYVWGTDIFWEKTCISGSSACNKQYGVMANYDSLSWKCGCTYGWMFGEDIMWELSCISERDYCYNKLWYWSEYDRSSWYCGCSSGYTLWKDYSGNYECQTCSSAYGINSKYNYLSESCECRDGYSFNSDSGKCEEKSYSAYFLLVKYDDSASKVLVYSSYTQDYYVLELRYTIGIYKVEDFVWKNIVINMGTDQKVNRWDKFVLNNETKTTDVVIDIQSVEDANDEYALDTCADIYGLNTIEVWDKCYCDTWYEWNSTKTSCIYKVNTSNSYNPSNQIVTNINKVNYYDSTEALNNANNLAGRGLILQVSNVTDYNLNGTILRQEIVWIALKIQGVSLAEDYKCKGLFKDVTSKKPNNWACRVAEVASENGIVSKENTEFRPEAKVSNSEALAMIFNAFGIEYNTSLDSPDSYYFGTVDWQKKIISHAKNLWLIENIKEFNPNENALRWQVFNFISKLLK